MHYDQQQQTSEVHVGHRSEAVKKAWHSLDLTILAVPSETLGGPVGAAEADPLSTTQIS